MMRDEGLTSIIPLNPEEKAIYEWQMWVPDFGEAGQEKLKGSSVLISRVGGLGGAVALELAAAGVGRLVLAHAGNVKPSDLNRQLLMTHDWIGKPRIESIQRKLNALNPHIEVVGIGENISENNVVDLVGMADIVIDCAPLFEERYLMNREAVRQNKPMIECAMHDLEGHLTAILPGKTPCLSCLYPDQSSHWKREFPVFGAVSGSVGCMAAMEAIKILAGFGEPLYGKMVTLDLRTMEFRKLKIFRDPQCSICGT